MSMKVILIVLDGAGVGALPDAHLYGDVGTATLQHVLARNPTLLLPNLQRLGLGNIDGMIHLLPIAKPLALYGKAAQRSQGKDTLVGHWELMGVTTEEAFGTFPNGFPRSVLNEFSARIGRDVLGNIAASGTEIIQMMGDEHVQTGFPIVYTSADSVFQIAAHEEVIPLERLYAFCRVAVEMLKDGWNVGRVIARPFAGASGAYTRTSNRRDFLVSPPAQTALTRLHDNRIPVIGVGKIEDIFGGVGLTKSVHTHSNEEGIEAVLKLSESLEEGLIFVNLVDYDMLYGHRRDAVGYSQALAVFDEALPRIMDSLADSDVLIITADHGCDPTHTGTDHTREYVPILLYRKSDGIGRDIGVRKSFADVGASVLRLFGLPVDFEAESII